MARLDHLALPVADVTASREWYTSVLGLEIEMESAEPPFCGLVDERDTTIFLVQSADLRPTDGMAVWFAVDDVVAFHQRHADTTSFSHGPESTAWGFGAELVDPTGHVVRVWDERSMASGRD